MRCATATRIILSFYGLLPRTITWYYMSCKGICIRHRATKLSNKMRYANGQKRCQMCDIFIKWDGIWCPCCGYRLRTKSRSGRLKQVTLINQVMIPTVSVRWSQYHGWNSKEQFVGFYGYRILFSHLAKAHIGFLK